MVRTTALGVIASLAFCSCAQSGERQAASIGTVSPAASIGTAVRNDLDREIDLRTANIEVQRGSLGHLMPLDSPQNDIDTFVFSGTNRSAKAIASFSATVALQDQAGTTLLKGVVQNMDAVPPQGNFLVRLTVANDSGNLPNPELVRTVSPAQTPLRYHVQAITYADGTKAAAAR